MCFQFEANKSDTRLLLNAKNDSEATMFANITNLTRNLLKKSLFPGHFEGAKFTPKVEKTKNEGKSMFVIIARRKVPSLRKIMLHHTRLIGVASAHFRKIPAPIKMKSALPPPQTQNPPPPPPKRGILWTWRFSCRKKALFPGVHKIGAAISGPRMADNNFTDMRIFLITFF